MSEESFPIDSFPELFRDLSKSISSVSGVPVAFPALTMLGLNSALYGKGVQLEFRDYLVRSNLFLVCSLPSGAGKSSTVNPLAKPIRDYEAKLRDQWEEEVRPAISAELKALSLEEKQHEKKFGVYGLDEYKARFADLERERAKLEAQKINPHRLIQDDVSQEKAVQTLSTNGGSILFLTTEGGRTIDNILGRMNVSTNPDDSHILAGFSGDDIISERLSRESVVKDPCTSLVWVLTPDRFDSILNSNQLKVGGFLPRCMLVPIECQYQDEDPYRILRVDSELLERWGRHCRVMLEAFHGKEPVTISTSKEASGIFTHYENQNGREADKHTEAIRSFMVRWREIALRIGLGLHMAEHLMDAPNRELSEETARKAVSIAKWVFKKQMYAVRGEEYRREEEKVEKASRLARDLGRIVPSYLWSKQRIEKDPKKQERILEELVTRSILEREIKNGKPTGAYIDSETKILNSISIH